MMIRKSGAFASSCAAVLLFAITAVAQTSTPSLQNDTGIHRQETYDGVRENINLATGGLNISIPLLSMPGRNGLDFSVSITYNSQFWTPQYSPPILYWTQEATSWLVSHPGPSGVNPTTTVNPNSNDPNNVGCLTGYVLEMGDGSKYSVPVLRTGCKWWDTVSLPNQPHWVDAPQYNVLTGGVYGGLDAYVDLNAGTLTMRDGSVASINGGTSGGAFSSLTDTNGNQITLLGPPYVDTLGRAITFDSGSVQYKDSNGALRTVTINYQSFTVSCTFPTPANSPGMPVSQPWGTLRFPSSVVLPNGLTYTFQYDGCGGLVKITYPSGGYTRYAYDYQSYTHRVENVGSPYAGPFTYPEVVAKYVCRAPAIAFGGTSTTAGANCPVPEDVTTYSPTIDNSTMVNNAANSVTDPLGNVTRYEFSQGSPSLSGPPLETKRTIYQGGSTLLRTIQTAYLSDPPFGYPTSKTTTLPNGLVTQTQWDYDSNHNVSEVREYSYGLGAPGPLVRKTHNTWGVFNRKTSEKIYDGSDNRLSETDYELDNYTAGISASGAVQHSSLFGPTYTNRGNVTAVTRWRNTDGAMLTTRNQYDDAGNVLSTTAPSNTPYDGLTRTTTYSYADSWGNRTCLPTGGSAKAYLTQVTDPAGLITKSSYNSCTGTKASSTDQNNQVSTYAYDLLNRQTQTTAPPADGGQISTCFSEVAGGTCYNASYPRKVVTTQKVTANINKISTAVMDGLSRVTQTQLNSDDDGITYVDTTYDGAEHKATVSNPYRSTSDPTYGITTSVYDALDRVTTLIPPDGTSASNNVTTNYDLISTVTSPPGNCSMVTDQANKFRQSCSDALGRLIEVDEPTSTANGTPGTGIVFISGSEQNPGPTHSRAVINISGFEQPPVNYCPPPGGTCQPMYDQGTYQLRIGTESYTIGYGQTSTSSGLASSLASSLNSSHLVTATANGGSVILTSIGTGPTTNYSLSSTFSWNSQFFPTPSFTFSTPSSMSGGSANPPDTGTVSVTVGAFTAQANYGVSSTTATVAGDLANFFNTNGLSPVTAAPFGNSLTLTAKTTGSGTNYLLTFAAASSNSYPQPSFQASAYTSSLTGGASSGGSVASAYVTLYNYDVLNNLLCVEQHGNVSGTGCAAAASSDWTSAWRVRRFAYNSLSQLLTSTNPEIAPTPAAAFCSLGYVYDNVGNLYQKTGPKPNQQSCTTTVTTTFAYDADNRPTQKSYNDGSTATAKYGYDGVALSGCTTTPPALTDNFPKGQRTAMCDGSGATSWKHDLMGRSLTESRKIGTTTKNISYTYNLDSTVASLIYPSGRTITYAPGGAGRPRSAIDASGPTNYVTQVVYAPPGELQDYRNGTSITNHNTYDKRLQPVTLSATSTSTILNVTYDFHLGTADNGNVYQIKNWRDDNRSQNFSYDSLNRITQGYSTGPIWGENFSTDQWGNLSNRSAVAGKTNTEGLSMAVLNTNRLSPGSYDAAGNMTSNGGATFTYDAENRLTLTAGVTYAYDGDGNRVKKSNGTLYWGAGLAESNLSAGATSWKEYIFFGGKRVARREAVDSKVHYYFSDHLGSSSVVTDALGTMRICTNSPMGYFTIPTGEEESDFYPYGGEMKLCDDKPQNYKFTGKERDAESGLDNFGARYDASSLGRFMTPDSIAYSDLHDPQSLNLYSYVGNHPTSMIDPDGRCWKWAQWICDQARNVGQRFDNAFHGEGFHTDKGVEDIAHRNNASRRQQEVNGTSRAASLGTRYANFHKGWDRWWAAHDCEGSIGGCGLAELSFARLGVYTRPTRTLFRAVDRAEFKDIQKTGKFRPSPGGAESKYFYPTLEQAEKMGERMYGEDYGIVSGNFPESAMEGPYPVATEGDVYVVPVENLELATPAVKVPLDDIPEVPE